MRRGTNLPAVGTFNHTVVLDVIRRNTEPMSRKEISATTGLALQTVRNSVERLLADGLIAGAGKRINGPGKPEMLFELVADGRFALGVHLDPTIITYVILDLRGRVVAESTMHMPSVGSPEDVIRSIGAALDRLIDESGVDRARILGIGIATPGPLDPVNGVILDPPLLLSWRNVPVRDSLSAVTGFPVILESGPTAAAIAEAWLGNDVVHDDFAFFYLGSGIGFGLVLDGQVRRGWSGNAGSGGTLFVPVDGLADGRRVDMLGHLATPQFMVAQAVADGVVDAPSPLNDTSQIERQFDRLLALADGGDEAALRILNRAAGLMAAALISVVNFLDVEEFIFGGPFWARVADRFIGQISDIVDHSPDRETVDFATANKDFLDGKAGMYIMGSWFTGTGYMTVAQSDAFGAFPLPTDNGDLVVPVNVGGTTSVSSKSPHAAQAMAFAQAWSLSPSSMKALIESDGAMPMMKKTPLKDYHATVSTLFTDTYKLITDKNKKVSAFGWVNNDDTLAPGMNDEFYALSQALFSNTDLHSQLAKLDADWDKATK